MRVYFMASTHGRKKYLGTYKKIVELVNQQGATAVEHVISSDAEYFKQLDERGHIHFHQKVLDEIKKADVIIAELSYTSTSMGYLVSTAVGMGKPVIVFYSGEEEPHLFVTLETSIDKFTVVRYKHESELDKEVPMILRFAQDNQDTRFNFFISPEISNYLNWVAKSRKVPRSVYLRKLIDEDMAQSEEYDLAA